MELGRFLGGLHPMFVHFPIVLILLAVACDVLAFTRRNDRLSWAGLWMTLLGTAFMLVAFVCGILAECFAARAGTPHEPMAAHERFATATTWLFIALSSFRLFMGTTPLRKSLALYLIVALVGCGLLIVTGHRGSHITYEYGANVAGVLPLHSPSDEDLAIIAQHQEQRTLTYSNQMHHIFGWLVLALSVSVFCERLRLGWLAKLRALMPVIFIGGGIYLFIYSDWDSWPISDLRPITDSEVMLHKVIAVMMFAGGVAALFRRSQSSVLSPQSSTRWVWQNKLIAVMALAGGGALFTHIHTNAPYVANAVGVYLNHTVMGLVALATAGAVLWEDARPRSRVIALLLPTLVLAQSIFLIKYNEDLPWFLGYGEIDATAPSGGVLAHVPGGRAELVFHPDSGTLDVFFWQSKQTNALPVAFQSLHGFVEAPKQKSSMEFRAVDGSDHHFRTEASWLRRVSLFTLRLNVPHGNGFATAEFDPVVTAPILPPLVGAEKVFGCPMCADVLSSKPAKCPMCGMELVQVPRERMLQKPQFGHDARFAMELKTGPVAARSDEATGLTFTMRDAGTGTVVKDFRVVHEKLLHLLLVSKDLSWFAHEHPELQSDGSFRLEQRFPFGGEFLLFADLAPADAGMQIFRLPQTVQGDARRATPLVENAGVAREFDGYHIGLRVTPNPPLRNDHAQLTFTLAKDDKPVDDLGLFLGAIGHCIIIHEDTETFIHSHPVQLTAAAPPPGGPNVMFHAYLPKRGLYKCWGQFNHRGKIITADFVFRTR